MPSTRICLAAAAAVALVAVSSAFGQSTCTSKADAQCPASKTAQLASLDDKPECAGAAQASLAALGDKASCDAPCSAEAFAAAGVPSPMCVVGDQVTSCPLEAMQIAEKTGEEPMFFVNNVRYSDPLAAGRAYARQLEGFYDQITSVQYAVGDDCVACPVAAKSMAKKTDAPVRYQLASYNFECNVQADTLAGLARKAGDAVAMTISVGDKECCCPMQAKHLAEKTGQPAQYTVGEQTVECEVMASVLHAMARVRAAIGTYEQAQSAT